MGKNDVEIQIRSRDATGPGIASAEKKVKELSNRLKGANELLRGGGAAAIFQLGGQALNTGLDRVAEVQKQIADGSLSASEGIEEVTLQLTRSIPVVGQFFTAGEKLRSIFDGTAMSAARAAVEIERHNKRVAEQAAIADRLRGIEANAETVRRQLMTPRERIEADFEETRKRLEADRRSVEELRGRVPEDQRIQALRNIAFQEEKATIKRLRDLEKEQEAWDKAKAAEVATFRKAEKEKADIRRQLRGNLRDAVLDAATQGGDGLDDLRDADVKSIQDRIRLLQRNAGGGLAGGESSRFLTGGAASAQERVATEAAKQSAQNEKQIELLQKMLKELEDQRDTKPIQLESGIFGGTA